MTEKLNYQECGVAGLFLAEHIGEILVLNGSMTKDGYAAAVQKTIDVFALGSDEQKETADKLRARFQGQGINVT